MNFNLTSKFFSAALAVTLMAGSGNFAVAQKNGRLWNTRQADLQAATLNGSHAKINALISKPGNSQDFVPSSPGNWQHLRNSAYSYDTQGRLTQRLYTDPVSNQNLGREIITYDAKGNETEYRVEAWTGASWMLDQGYKTFITYNTLGNKTEVTYEYWNPSNNSWVKDDREEYAYDTNNLVTSITNSDWNGNAWEFIDRMLLNNTGGVGTSAIVQEYDNGVWKNVLRAQNLTWRVMYEILSAYELEEFDNNTWEKVEKYASVYDANGGHVGVYEEWTGTTWEKSFRETETFDNNKNYTGWKDETWNSTTNTWEHDFEDRQVLTYSGIDITQRIFQSSYGSPTGTLQDESKEVYSNFQTFNVSGVKNQLAENAFNVFPNPATDKIQITSEAINGEFTATITDVTGKTWLAETISPSEVKQLNIEVLPAGIYLLNLQSETGFITKRIVKQ